MGVSGFWGAAGWLATVVVGDDDDDVVDASSTTRTRNRDAFHGSDGGWWRGRAPVGGPG